jgi:HSP20 family protein
MSPGRDIDDLQRQIQELFNDLWKVPRFSGLREGFRPNADCYRTDNPPALHIVVELAGVEAESIQVLVAGRTVVVAGRRERTIDPGVRIQQLELDYGPFERQIQLAEDVDSEKTTATYERGLLEITLPVVEDEQPQSRVPIEVRRTR